jgi:hypothetical protein
VERSTSLRAVPATIAFQGFLTDSASAPIDGTVDLVLAIWDMDAGGDSVWSEPQTGVDVADGVFSIALGAVTSLPLDIFDGSPLYLGVSVDGEPELPRTELHAVPYAMRAAVADSAVAGGAGADSDWTIDGDDIYRLTGKVGIGTDSPQRALHVANDMRLEGAILDLHGSGDALPDYDQDTVSEFGVCAKSTTAKGRLSLRFRQTAGGGVGSGGIRWGELDDNDFYLYRRGDPAKLKLDYVTYGPGAGDDVLKEVLTVEIDGKVGIGTSSPSARLDVRGSLEVEDDAGNLLVKADEAGAGGGRLQVHTASGEVPIKLTAHDGRVKAKVLEVTGADLVECFSTRDNGHTPGTVMIIDDREPGLLTRSSRPYDPRVAGVVSGAGGVASGIHMGRGSAIDGDTPVALTGRVYVKCTTEAGRIRPGDLLTTSSTPGHAMRAADPAFRPGAVLGKAMSSLEDDDGLVLVLVSLQ